MGIESEKIARLRRCVYLELLLLFHPVENDTTMQLQFIEAKNIFPKKLVARSLTAPDNWYE